jgi:secretion/DNA translocation related TadE-like protein
VRRGSDRGSATIWVIAFATLISLMALVGVARTSAVLARHRLERAADLSALAAANQIGRGADPCAAARRISIVNDARLQRCETRLDASGRSGTVIVVLTRSVVLPAVGHRVVTARARAGRLSAGS